MLQTEQWMDLHHLRKQGLSIRAIARSVGHSRNTVRKMLRSANPPAFEPPSRKSGVDDFKEYLNKRYTEHGLSAVRLVEEIRPQGFEGSVYMVRRFLRTLRPARAAAARATVRFDTPPGVQAQADWAYCGRHRDRCGHWIGVYAFVMVLSFSRMMFVRFTTSMRLGELIACHRKAFDYFGGWPGVVLYDNMKQVKLSAAEWNQPFLDFAGHYGFIPKTCRIRRARTKGKVERMVDYVKDNFLNGREFADLEDLNVQGVHWLNTRANVRVHATTQRRPVDLLPEEHLRSVGSIAPYKFVERHARKVGAESMVSFQSSRYSVPPAYVGQDVTVSHEDLRIVVRAGDLVIAEHAPSGKRGSFVSDKSHVAELWKLTLRRAPDPVPSWKLTFDQQVATPTLDRYEQLARGQDLCAAGSGVTP